MTDIFFTLNITLCCRVVNHKKKMAKWGHQIMRRKCERKEVRRQQNATAMYRVTQNAIESSCCKCENEEGGM